jgi:putative acetyltransferase
MNTKIAVRSYNETDAPFLAAIYFYTIHNINAKDYSLEQINAWAPSTSLATEGWVRKWKKIPPIVADHAYRHYLDGRSSLNLIRKNIVTIK